MDEAVGRIDVSLRERALEEIDKGQMASGMGRGPDGEYVQGAAGLVRFASAFWGVPIPVFYCTGCDEAVADPKIIDHVADIFAKETADAWYARPESELLPDGYKCAKCDGADFRKETDILDVWFDSGSSCVAVLETRGETLRFPADVYLEGGDQYRGWFNSSLSCGIAAHDTAPYKQIITHGWVVDGEGKKQMQSRSATSPLRRRSSTNRVPRSCVYGPRRSIIPRTCAARTRSCSRVVDAYRKIAKYAALRARQS